MPGAPTLMKNDEGKANLPPLVAHLVALNSLKNHQKSALGNLPLEGTPEEVTALERYIAYQFGKILQDKQKMSSAYAELIPSDLLDFGSGLLKTHPEVSEAELREAEAKIAPLK